MACLHMGVPVDGQALVGLDGAPCRAYTHGVTIRLLLTLLALMTGLTIEARIDGRASVPEIGVVQLIRNDGTTKASAMAGAVAMPWPPARQAAHIVPIFIVFALAMVGVFMGVDRARE